MASDAVASTINLARLALQAHEFGYQVEAEDRLAIDYGSARLTILVRRRGESAVMRVSACVLDDIDVTDDAELRLHRSLNERNRTLPYAKFFFDHDAGEIHVEYELLGDDLQDTEFMNALTTIAQLADDHDDILLEELGHGRRATDRA
jgi:antitoxin component of MazEF toxin-antitoxin module